jgi:hypothetical protein
MKKAPATNRQGPLHREILIVLLAGATMPRRGFLIRRFPPNIVTADTKGLAPGRGATQDSLIGVAHRVGASGAGDQAQSGAFSGFQRFDFQRCDLTVPDAYGVFMPAGRRVPEFKFTPDHFIDFKSAPRVLLGEQKRRREGKTDGKEQEAKGRRRKQRIKPGTFFHGKCFWLENKLIGHKSGRARSGRASTHVAKTCTDVAKSGETASGV